MSIETLIRDVARQVAREEVRAALGCVDAIYSTASSAAWPPGCRSHRIARERIRVVPGHEREGNGRATVWRVSAAAYHDHHRKVAPVGVVAAASSTEEEIAEAALDAAGFRTTRTR